MKAEAQAAAGGENDALDAKQDGVGRDGLPSEPDEEDEQLQPKRESYSEEDAENDDEGRDQKRKVAKTSDQTFKLPSHKT